MALYLRDQLFPEAYFVFFSAAIDSVLKSNPLFAAWASVSEAVRIVVKSPSLVLLEKELATAVERFLARAAPTAISEESRWLQPAADELASLCAMNSDYLERMSPRNLEEMIDAIFRNHGFTTSLTQLTHDGGYDLRLLSRNGYNRELILVECKRYLPRRKIEVGIVRQLYGVKALHGADAAYLVTSSYISRYAKREFEAVTPIELRFFERNDVLEWCRRHFVACSEIPCSDSEHQDEEPASKF